MHSESRKLRFFLDRNVSSRLAEMVAIFDRGNQVDYHDQHFDQTTTDVEWITAVRDWNPRPALVSGDLAILRNKAEASILQQTELTFFALESAWPCLRWEDFAWRFLKIWPEICKNADTRKPSIFRVPVSAGRVEFMCHTVDLPRGRHRGG